MSVLVKTSHIWGKEVTDNSIIVENGKIKRIGFYGDLSKDFMGEIHDYEKGMVIPGFCDAHLHMAWLGQTLTLCDLRECKSSAEFLDKIRAYAKKLAPGEFLRGFGWDDRAWSDNEKPTRWLIDDATCGHKCSLTKVDGHSFLINSEFMMECGVTGETTDTPGGRIGKNQDGEPDGMFYDSAFDEYARKKIPSPTTDQLESFLLKAAEHLLSYGITSCRTFGTLDDFVTLAHMDRKGILKIRTCACIPENALAWAVDLSAKTGTGSEMFWTGQLKLFADGSLGSKTALVSEPYSDGTKGIEVTTIREMKEKITMAHQIGLGVAIHAIGDEAVKNVLNVFGESSDQDTIEHFQCAKPQSIALAAKLGIPVVVNPSHMPLDAEAIKVEWPKLAQNSYPLASLIKAGAIVGFGSDAPVVDPNPLTALACATTRGRTVYDQINPQEAISFSQAIRIATKESSAIIGGPERGLIEEGQAADFAVLLDDIRGKDPWDVEKVPFVATYVAGERVWKK